MLGYDFPRVKKAHVVEFFILKIVVVQIRVDVRLVLFFSVVSRPYYSVGECVMHDGDLEGFPSIAEEWGSLPFGNLRHLPIRVVWCARLWLALPVSVDRKSVVTNWFAGIAGAIGMRLGLNMLPDAGSRGRFCADMSVGAVSAGPEAEEAGRASAGSIHLNASPKNRFTARVL
eukprot:scaffold5296_cov105-Isochrysis_galbana.AAC.9